MTPEEVREWVKIGRDVVIVAVGAFILIHETIASHGSPNLSLLGTGLALFGVPPALRYDYRKLRKAEDTDDA